MMAPTRPVLRWHGGKWKLAPWIIGHFPAHRVYVESFGGAASVLLQKPPALTEVWNDLEAEAVNLFAVLRISAEALATAIALTPFSRTEYHTLYAPTDDPIERARRFVARSFMGQSSKGALRKSGFDSRINPDGFASRLNCLRALPEQFAIIAARLAGVILEQRPAAAIFAQYDRADALFYVDPPYLGDHAKHYTHELDGGGARRAARPASCARRHGHSLRLSLRDLRRHTDRLAPRHLQSARGRRPRAHGGALAQPGLCRRPRSRGPHHPCPAIQPVRGGLTP